jgi:hypothetical protein
VRDDFKRLESPDHWLGWLPDTPGQSVRRQLEQLLAGQVGGTILHWVKIVDEPAFLTAGVRSGADPEQRTIGRTALAVQFALGAQSPRRKPEILTGTFTWAVTGLDQPGSRRDRMWLDVNMPRAQAAELLMQRIYQVGEDR